MVKLKNKYVIGTHVMFFEIEMYKDFVDGMINLLEDVENKENVTIDLCFNMTEMLEKIDYDKISENELLNKFFLGVDRLKGIGMENIVVNLKQKDDFYIHADYRRDLNYN